MVTVTKTADAASVSAGSQIGFTVTLSNSTVTTATGLSVTDNLPAATDVSWMIDAGNTSAGWSVSGSPPNQSLVYNPTTLAGNTSTTAHVVSTTTTNSCGVYNNSASFTTSNDGSGSASNSETVLCPPILNGVVSTRNHGGAGDFTITMPLTGSPGIECRIGSGGGGNYTLVFTFNSNVTSVDSATVTSHNPLGAAGTVSTSSLGPAANQYTVNLTSVDNAQYLIVTLNNVNNGGDVVSPKIGFLIGDVNATGGVDGNDVSAVQAHTRQAVSDTTFQFDVNTTGAIDGNDVSATQSKTRTSLPSPP